MSITVDVARNALRGAKTLADIELFAQHNFQLPTECYDAIKAVEMDEAGFRKLVLDTMQQMPNFKATFGKLVRTRIYQKGFLSSELIFAVFDSERTIENRLQRINDNVLGAEYLQAEHRNVSKDENDGKKTDDVARDLLAEVLVLDLLIESGFSEIKRPYSQGEAHVDVIATKDRSLFAIEVTRKQEVDDWETVDFGSLEDCNSPTNMEKIRAIISSALSKKNGHFFRALKAGTVSDKARRVVAVKTSDFGFSECIKEAETITREILSHTDNCKHIDCVWLIPNICLDQSKWVCRE